MYAAAVARMLVVSKMVNLVILNGTMKTFVCVCVCENVFFSFIELNSNIFVYV